MSGMERDPYLQITLTDEECEGLLALRKLYTKLHQELAAAQKRMAAAKDYEGAKLVKPFVAEHLRMYRACCLLAGYFLSHPPGDCREMPVRHWPAELHPELRLVLGYLHYPELMRTALLAENYDYGVPGAD